MLINEQNMYPRWACIMPGHHAIMWNGGNNSIIHLMDKRRLSKKSKQDDFVEDDEDEEPFYVGRKVEALFKKQCK
jgi:hypothetical protein